jgi:hypothetical protein
VFATCVVAQPKIDPQSLIGESQGGYSQSGYRGSIYLTLKKVDGNTVYGVAEITAPTSAATRYLSGDNEGTLDGNVIKWHKLASWGEFTVNGKEMVGTIMAPSRADVTLRKTK